MLTTQSRSAPALRPPQAGAWLAELRATAALSGPLVLTNLAQVAMGATDVMMMGWVSAETLAAGALGVNVYFAALILGIGLTNATSPMVARELGRNINAVRDVRRTVRQGLWAAACIALPCWLVLWWTEPILIAMGQAPALSAAAGAYVRALQWSLLPFLGFLVLRAFVSALERPAWAMVIGLAAVVFNAGANWCLLLGRCGAPPLGIVGSGLATLLSNILMFIAMALVVILDRRFARFRPLSKLWRPDWPRFRAFWQLGLPMAAMLSFETTIFNAAVFLMGVIGTPELAAHSIAIQLASLTFMVPFGIAQAATVRVGRAYGAGDASAISRAGWVAVALGVGFMTLTALVMLLAPRLLIAAFIDPLAPQNARIVELAVLFLAMAALFQVVDGAQVVGAGMLRGLHDARVPMVYALIGYWGVGFPLGAALAFAAGLGGVGIWIGLATGLAVVACLMIGRWARRASLGLILPLT
jgi:multidrug resistance protein, MATE family